MKKVRTAVIGCGAISEIYLRNMSTVFRDRIDLIGCCATTRSHAMSKANKFSIRALLLDEVLMDPDIELVVNLTPPAAHYELIRRSLLAGKHVYTEKTLTTSFAESCVLRELAISKGLVLASAPDTFLGDAFQAARSAIDSDVLGQITGFSAIYSRNSSYFYERLAFTRTPGAGIGYDIGIYYITVLLSLLGPASWVSGAVRTSRPIRKWSVVGQHDQTDAYTVHNENIMTATVCMQNGVLGSLFFCGDCTFPSQHHFVLYGTQGILCLPNPDLFEGETELYKSEMPGEAARPVVLRKKQREVRDLRGIGIADMAEAIRTGRNQRASVDMAVHALELLDSIVQASTDGCRKTLTSTFERPPLL